MIKSAIPASPTPYATTPAGARSADTSRILAFMAMPTFGMQHAVGSSSFAKTYIGDGFGNSNQKNNSTQ